MNPRLKAIAKTFLQAASRALERDIGLGAAGVAYFGILSIAPALAAIVSLYGLIGDPARLRDQIAALGRIAPPEVTSAANEQLSRLIETDTGLLAWSGVLALALSIWSANRSVDGFLQALARVDGGSSRRGFVQQTLVSLAFTVGAILVVLLALLALAIIPVVLNLLSLDPTADFWVLAVRWPVLLATVCAYVAAVYRWGPNRPPPRWKAVWPFAALTTAVWVAGSFALTALAPLLGSSNAAYGSLAGAAGILLWLFVSAFIFLMGGAFTSASERTTIAVRRAEAARLRAARLARRRNAAQVTARPPKSRRAPNPKGVLRPDGSV